MHFRAEPRKLPSIALCRQAAAQTPQWTPGNAVLQPDAAAELQENTAVHLEDQQINDI